MWKCQDIIVSICMWNKISSIFTIFKNFDNIKKYLNESYIAIVRLHASLVFIESQITDTKLGKLLQDYLPKVIEILSKIKELFEKYGKYIELDVSASAQSVNISESSLLKELDDSVLKLNGFLLKD